MNAVCNAKTHILTGDSANVQCATASARISERKKCQENKNGMCVFTNTFALVRTNASADATPKYRIDWRS